MSEGRKEALVEIKKKAGGNTNLCPGQHFIVLGDTITVLAVLGEEKRGGEIYTVGIGLRVEADRQGGHHE